MSVAGNKINEKLFKFFNGDELAIKVWSSKYKFGDEETPEEMFNNRIIPEIVEIEMEQLERVKYLYLNDRDKFDKLSAHVRSRYLNFINSIDPKMTIENHYRKYINLKANVPAGSMLQGIGRLDLFSSLSNCFVLGQPYDSYSGINQKEDQLTQVMKRRGGGGLDLSTIRPAGSIVHNQSGVSSGIVLFADGYSNKTKQVSQYGRRGALMLSVSILHPDSLEFIESKQDLQKITGANISVKVPDEFMIKLLSNSDDRYFLQRWPVDANMSGITPEMFKEGELFKIDPSNLNDQIGVNSNPPEYVKKINIDKLWNRLIECAWSTAEPGILFEGGWMRGGLDWFYPQYRPVSTNPCSELPMQPFDSCRLIAANFLSLVVNKFKETSYIDYNYAENLFYEQLMIADILVSLEIRYIDRIINKIKSSEDPQDLKDSELKLWETIRKVTSSGRRCGAGFLGLGDMLAALNQKYYSPDIIKKVFKLKLSKELEASIDLAIIHQPFEGFNPEIEKSTIYNRDVIAVEYPELYAKMLKYGRRNVSFSTGAPTGTLSLMTQTTSGIEPLFSPYSKRRKKCITPDERIDFVDVDGQKFTEYFVLHEQFKLWINEKTSLLNDEISNLTQSELDEYFKQSPWYKQCAEDIEWNKRVEIQSIVQQYTTQAISSTINLPKDCKQDDISKIYIKSWQSGLKGNTVYREGSRSGVIVKAAETIKHKRPRSLPAHYHTLKYGGKLYSIIIGFKDNQPFEIFIVSGLENLPEILFEKEYIVGSIDREAKDLYYFSTSTFTLKDITDMEDNEKLLSLMISGLMRNNTKLTDIIKIITKSKPIAGSFTHKLIKILSQYVINGEKSGDKCDDCGADLVYEDGCVICKSCGWTKC